MLQQVAVQLIKIITFKVNYLAAAETFQVKMLVTASVSYILVTGRFALVKAVAADSSFGYQLFKVAVYCGSPHSSAFLLQKNTDFFCGKVSVFVSYERFKYTLALFCLISHDFSITLNLKLIFIFIL